MKHSLCIGARKYGLYLCLYVRMLVYVSNKRIDHICGVKKEKKLLAMITDVVGVLTIKKNSRISPDKM